MATKSLLLKDGHTGDSQPTVTAPIIADNTEVFYAASVCACADACVFVYLHGCACVVVCNSSTNIQNGFKLKAKWEKEAS